MKARELLKLGLSRGPTMKLAQRLLMQAADAGLSRNELRDQIKAVVANPEANLRHPHFADLAVHLRPEAPPEKEPMRQTQAPWRQWGDNLEEQAVSQMEVACRLPVAVSGALMPDAHLGYGLPIGGVLATDNAVIPYAVGVDIACRMKLTVTDLPVTALKGQHQRLVNVLEQETRFGIGAHFQTPRDHEVMEDDWSASPVTQRFRDRAWRQLGSSGSGNHFVEYGTLVLEEPDLGLGAGEYVALLSHSGSRGPGNEVARHYSRLAMEQHRGLPKEMRHLAWLDLDSELGQEYWQAMQLMGRFAAANHALIHHYIVKRLRAKALLEVENHHNFAWKEEHNGREVVVHRKGATPAGKGVLGIIPGSMAAPGFVVRGKGSEAALRSASHGAGRVMSRKKAKHTFTWSSVRKQLADQGITVLSAGLDESPGVYKDIHQVMAAQKDLVEVVARFEPKIVKMAPPGD